MKALLKLATVLSFIFCLSGQVNANDRAVNGLIIGGGAGAIMGQAVGRNVESTVIGATVGGLIGAAIGAESSHRHQDRVIIHERPRGPHGRHFNHAPRYNPPRVVHNNNYYRGHNGSRDRVVIVEKQRGRKNVSPRNCRPHNRKHYNQSQNKHNRRYQHNNNW